MQPITMDKALELLRRAVSEKGADHKDPVSITREDVPDEAFCHYFDGPNSPACIVGHVLHYAGFVPDEGWLHLHNDDGVDDLSAIDIETNALKVLCAAQTEQDECNTWGEALAAAEARAAQLRQEGTA